jgi:hypothetical protein
MNNYLTQQDQNTKTKIIPMYQIYDDQGNKRYEPFYCQESAEYMMQYSGITGQVIEIETEFIPTPCKLSMINKGNQHAK